MKNQIVKTPRVDPSVEGEGETEKKNQCRCDCWKTTEFKNLRVGDYLIQGQRYDL